MLLSKIFKNTDVKVTNDIDIKKITIDSRLVKPGYLFVAIKGFEQDGHKYIESAIENGASAVLIDEERLDDFKDVNAEVLTAKNTRFLLSPISINFYENPSKEFKLIGITGTKGKTTTSFMIKKILEEDNKKVGLVGTVACYSGKKKLMDSERTTPEAIELQEMFRTMADDGCEYVIMEVSSQSLKIGRIDGLNFETGLFTNLSEDHISPHEHPTMKDYFLSKAKLFDMTNNGFCNIDEPKSLELIDLKPNCKFGTYSIHKDSDKKATNITITNVLTTFNVNINNKEELVKISIPGEFTVYNALGAISICEYLGCSSESIIKGLKKVRVPGRSELVDNDLGLAIMIDYAHSPESLENILKAVKLYTKGRVISLFGCGGDRDSRKRPKMAKISGEIADYTIITSDNPRTEDPVKIVNDVEEGIKGITDNYEVIVDRKKAIEKAVKMAKPEDIVVLAGKGHETYQIIGHEYLPFDEKEIVENIIKKMS